MSAATRTPMADARDWVTVEVEFVIDIELPDMLHPKILRSPFPHAKNVRKAG